MAVAKKKKKCDCEQGAPMWVVTYGDLMSLLMTFFVLLLSFSTMEKPREFEEAIISIKGAFGIFPKNVTQVQINPMPIRIRRPNRETEDMARRVQRGLQVIGQQEAVEVKYDTAGGIKISLPGELLFAQGQATVREDAYAVLDQLGAILAEMPETFFEVRGHTDNIPLGDTGQFRDNYDLSYARADSVARYISAAGNIPIAQFEIIAAGAGQPVATNTTPEGRQANRRVELFVRGPMDNERVRELQQRVRRLTNDA